MKSDILALLVHDGPASMGPLQRALEDLSLTTFSARTCGELGNLMRALHPDVVFTETRLPDGSWQDVVDTVRSADAPASVVVVGSTADTRLCLSVLERGAFDLMLPPFEPHTLEFVVYSALDNSRERRKTPVVRGPSSLVSCKNGRVMTPG